MSVYCIAVFSVVCFFWFSLLLWHLFLQYSDTVGSVFWPVKPSPI